MDVELIKKEYFNALYNQQNGSNQSMVAFRLEHPKEYAVINAMYHKRVKVKQDIEVMTEMSLNKVYFGALTFDNEQDSKSESTKRKQGWRHLNNVFSMVLMIEEHGEENGRYHIHFVGVFKDGKTMEDFHNWNSGFSFIEKIISKKKVARYLCNYVVKQVPRLRRNKCLLECSKQWKKAQSLRNYGFGESLGKEHIAQAFSVLFLSDLDVLEESFE